MIGITTKGNHKKTSNSLKKMTSKKLFANLHMYGRRGVQALSKATPVDSRLTADSWEYRIVQERNGPRIEWYNTATEGGQTSIAILIQYGHGTRNGGYVQGRDFINPAIQPLFDEIVKKIWKEVTNA